MPRHQQVPVSKMPMCEVCGGAESTLTTDCPGTKIDAERLQELAETMLDYADARGWHLAVSGRSPRFGAPLPVPPTADQRAGVAPGIDWAAVDRTAELQHVLTQKAIAWVIADRACDDQSARLTSAEDAARRLRGTGALDAQSRSLAKLEREKIDFHVACRRLETCEEEFKQAARVLVASLEERSLVDTPAEGPESAAP
jgi:hypothetical protein